MNLRTFVFASVIAGLVLVRAAPVSADCNGPTLSYTTGSVAPGSTVEVTGRWFGDDCLDTGLPDGAHGVLGEPIDDIEIVLVQGAAEWPLATVDADDAYRFSVDVALPTDVAAGEVEITARWPRNSWSRVWIDVNEPLIVDDDRASSPSTPVPTTEAPATTAAPAPSSSTRAAAIASTSEPTSDSSSPGLTAMVLAATALATAGAAIMIRRGQNS